MARQHRLVRRTSHRGSRAGIIGPGHVAAARRSSTSLAASKPKHSPPPGVAVNRTVQIARAHQQQRQLPSHHIDGHHHPWVIRINSLVHQRLAILSIHIQLDAQPGRISARFPPR